MGPAGPALQGGTLAHPSLNLPPLPPHAPTTQVAGLKYKVKALVNGATEVVVTAYKPLPHTGQPLEVQGVEAGGAL